MEKETFKKLTEEEKQKVISVINELLFEELPNDPAEDDVFYNQKIEEFTMYLTEDNEPCQIEALLNMCDNYIAKKGERNEKIASHLAFAIMFDMWLNKSAVWPVPLAMENK